jgi:hypothetical protein
MTVGEYAAHRKVSRQAILRQIEDGAISAKSVVIVKGKKPGTKHKRVNAARADLDLEFAGDPRKRPMSAKPSKQLREAKEEPAEPEQTAEELQELKEIDDKIERYRDARTSTEELKARKLELEILSREGRLLDVNVVRERIAQLVTETKDAILNVPSRIAPNLVSITDPVDMETTLLQELNNALANLSRLEGEQWE